MLPLNDTKQNAHADDALGVGRPVSVMFLVMMCPVLYRCEAKLIHVRRSERAEQETSGKQQ